MTPKKCDIEEALQIVTEAVESTPQGDRCIVVLDRGWIFAGNLTETSSGKYRLTNAVNIRKWNQHGFGGVTKGAKYAEAILDPSAPLEFNVSAIIFTVPIKEDWHE